MAYNLHIAINYFPFFLYYARIPTKTYSLSTLFEKNRKKMHKYPKLFPFQVYTYNNRLSKSQLRDLMNLIFIRS